MIKLFFSKILLIKLIIFLYYPIKRVCNINLDDFINWYALYIYTNRNIPLCFYPTKTCKSKIKPSFFHILKLLNINISHFSKKHSIETHYKCTIKAIPMIVLFVSFNLFLQIAIYMNTNIYEIKYLIIKKVMSI